MLDNIEDVVVLLTLLQTNMIYTIRHSIHTKEDAKGFKT